ncbi:MAG: hypothetical protein ACI4Q3_09825 [Kiritimatiellia bacterium]
MFATVCLLAAALTFDFPSLSAAAFNRPVPPCPAADPAPIRFSHPVFEKLDGAFAIASNRCGVIVFAARRDPVPADRADAFDWKAATYRLTLPRGFAFVDASCAAPSSVAVRTGPDGETEVSFRLRSRQFMPPAAAQGGCRFGVAIRAEGGGAGRLRLCAQVPGVAGPPPVCAVDLFTVPFRSSASPRGFGVGAYLDARCHYFPTAAGDRAFADLLQAAGVNWLIPVPPVVRQEEGGLTNRMARWRRMGVRRITPDVSHVIANGYSVGTRKSPREADLFIGVEAEGRPLGRGTLCPAAIYEEREIFSQGVLPELLKALAGGDGAWSNWEPFAFRTKGCFCAGCRARFAAFARVDEADLAADWPAALLPGGRWFAEGCRFRRIEHAKVVRTLARHVANARPADGCGFIPGVCWGDLAAGWTNRWYCSEASIGDCLADLAWVNPFGPYVRWDSSRPFDGRDGAMLATFLVAREVRRQVDADHPPAGSKKLMAFPLGLIGETWLTQPEWIRMAQETFFWLGWDASIPWRFPEGADARYWRAFAEASDHIARHEDLRRGARLTDEILVRPTCDVPTRSPGMWYLPREPQSLFQQLVFRTPSGSRFAVVFNFSDVSAIPFDVVGASPGRAGRVPPCSVLVLKDV